MLADGCIPAWFQRCVNSACERLHETQHKSTHAKRCVHVLGTNERSENALTNTNRKKSECCNVDGFRLMLMDALWEWCDGGDVQRWNFMRDSLVGRWLWELISIQVGLNINHAQGCSSCINAMFWIAAYSDVGIGDTRFPPVYVPMHAAIVLVLCSITRAWLCASNIRPTHRAVERKGGNSPMSVAL